MTPLNGGAAVYLAGPLFTQGERHWNDDLAAALRAAGFSVAVPQEQATVILAEGGLSPTNVRKLFEVAIQSIESSKAVVAILDGPDADSGTCFECGYAYAIKRPVLGIRTDIRLGGDDPSKNVNLMLSQSCGRLLVLADESFSVGPSELTSRIVAALGELGVHS